MLSERFAIEAEELKKKYEENIRNNDSEGNFGYCRAETVNFEALKKTMAEQMRYMERTLFEMRPIEDGYHFVKNRIPVMDEGVVF